MYGLLLLAMIVVWGSASIAIAFWVGRILIEKKILRLVVTLLLIPLLFLAPLADEIIGKFQFDRLCKAAEDVKIYGTSPVGEELYTADGRWRLSTIPPKQLDEFNRVENIYKSLIRDQSRGPNDVGVTMPIFTYEHIILVRTTDQPLASFKIYGTSGGWISRNFEKPLIVRDVCWPSQMGQVLDQRILPFKRPSGGQK